MEWKWSQYNCVFKMKNKRIILVNLMYFTCVEVDKRSCIVECIGDNSKISELSSEVINQLNKLNFIVKADFNEKEYCDFIRNRSVYSTQSMRIMLLPTDACNFRCVYCYENAENRFLSRENEQSLLKFFERKIPTIKELRISWFGGEPLVRKEQVLRITKYINDMCKRNGVAFSGEMTTNGYELDLETFNQLIQNRIIAYQICIDGNEVSHNKQRPHITDTDSYHRILRNIKNIKTNCLSNTFLILLRSNVTEETERYLESYLNEIYSIIGKDKRFEIAFQGVRNWGGNRIASNGIITLEENEDSIYEKWYSRAAEIGLNSAEKMDLSVFTGVCEGNEINSFVIYPDCSVHKCTMCYYNQELRSAGHIGSITNDGRLLTDDKKESIWMSRKNNNLPMCDECKMYPICKGGSCPYHTNIMNQSMKTTNHCSCLAAMVKAKVDCMFIKNQIQKITDNGDVI